MAFLEHQVILVIKQFGLICCISILFGCSKPDTSLTINALNTNLILDNGVLLYNDKPFSGKLVSYFNNNQLQFQTQYVNGKKEGTEQHWFNNGSLAQERFYTKGKKTGIHRGFWNNGNLKFVYHFNNKGAYNGSVKEWFKQGQLYKAFNYTNGKENGKQRLWEIDGSVRANYEVVNGERFGLIGLKKCYTVTEGSNVVK